MPFPVPMKSLTEDLLRPAGTLPKSRIHPGGRTHAVAREDRSRDLHRSQVCYPDVQEWQAQSTAIEDAAAFSGYWSPVLTGSSGAEQLDGVRVSTGFFRVLKFNPCWAAHFCRRKS